MLRNWAGFTSPLATARASRSFATQTASCRPLTSSLTDRMWSLLLSGSWGERDAERAAAWPSLRGLLLGVTALGTREVG